MIIFHAALTKYALQKYYNRFPIQRLNVLKSFCNDPHDTLDFVETDRYKVNKVILDSGTWALNQRPNLARYINLNNYLRYLERNASYFDYYFNFDANFDADGFEDNLDNYNQLVKAGFSPVPVIHDIFGDEIPYYRDRGVSMIALGSTQIRSLRNMDIVFNKLSGTKVKVHLLGRIQYSFLADFPLYSCDSSGWTQTGNFGRVYFWNPEKNDADKTDILYLEERYNLNGRQNTTGIPLTSYPHKGQFNNYLKQKFGFTKKDLLGVCNSYNKSIVNLHYYSILESEINRLHRKNGFLDTAGNINIP